MSGTVWPVCACGEVLPSESTGGQAFAAWDLHRKRVMFG